MILALLWSILAKIGNLWVDHVRVIFWFEQKQVHALLKLRYAVISPGMSHEGGNAWYLRRVTATS